MKKKTIFLILFIFVLIVISVNRKEYAETQKYMEATIVSNPPATETVKSGDIITYTITLKNISDIKFSSSRLIIALPAGTQFESINTKNYEKSDFYITVTFGNIEPGKDFVTELKLKVTGTTDEVKYPGIEYFLLNSEHSLLDLIMVSISDDFISATTAEERQAVLGDIACNGDLVLDTAHKVVNDPDVIESEKYKIEKSMIKNIEANTTVENLLSNITNKGEGEIKIYKGEQEVKADEKVATSMILKVNDREYIIIVTGDINEDGNQSAVDLSLLKGYIIKNYNFVENKLAASDLNGDGKVSVTDLSRLKMQLVGLKI